MIGGIGSGDAEEKAAVFAIDVDDDAVKWKEVWKRWRGKWRCAVWPSGDKV